MKTSKLFTDVDTCIVDEDTIKKKNEYNYNDLRFFVELTLFCANIHSLTSSFSSSHRYRRLLGT